MLIEELYNHYLKAGGIEIDSSKIKNGDIFFAVGRKDESGVHRGCNFAEKALESGAEFVIINNPELKKNYKEDERWILVEDCEETLQKLGSYHRSQLKIPVIAIAGSNGKTTTKELLTQILSKKYNCFATPGNLNNHLGVPLSILKINTSHEIAIIEIGANHLGETEFLCEIAKPGYGILTNCGKDHLGEYGSLENIIKANKELYDYLEKNTGTAFVNASDELLMSISFAIQKRLFYGTESSGLSSKVLDSTMLSMELNIEGEVFMVETSLFGEFWKDAVMAASKIGHYFGVANFSIKEALEEYRPSALRSQLVEWSGHQVLLDCYNANPSSMEVFIDSAAKSPFENKIIILGEMLELGFYAEEEHQNLVDNFISYDNFDFVLLTGEEFGKISLRNSNTKYFSNNEELKNWLSENLKAKKYQFFVKGSRANKLEKLFGF